MDLISSSDIIYLIFIMIATAIPAGFAAGLFGIGGGLITVPILFYIFSTSGIDPKVVLDAVHAALLAERGPSTQRQLELIAPTPPPVVAEPEEVYQPTNTTNPPEDESQDV